MTNAALTSALPVRTPRAPVNKWLVTVSVTFGTLMGAIDSSIVNVAIPHIRGAVGASITEITWIATGFVIATVIVMPLTAFLGRFFGQKRFYMFSLVLFLVGSALCGMARSLWALVAFRAVQGLGAGALQPTEQAILRQTFPPEEQGMAMALFGMSVMLGPAFGPTLGGYIVDHYSWEWIFYINLPVGALGLFMVSRFVHEPEDIRAKNHEMAAKQRGNLDWPGILLLTLGLAALQYMLEEGQSDDWFSSPVIAGCAIFAFFALAAFTIRELTTPVPAVNLSLFKDKVFMSGTLVGAMMFAMLMANMFLLPLFMQELLGFSAVDSGLALMPRTLVMMLATPIVGHFYNKVSPRVMIAIGIVAFSIGAYQMSHFTLDTTESGIIGAIIIQGVGFSCLFVPLTTVALSTIERHKMTDATGLNSLLRQIGGSMGLAVFATYLTTASQTARASISANLSPTRAPVRGFLHAAQAGLMSKGYDPVSAEHGALGALAGKVSRQAYVLGFDKVFLLSGIMFLFVLPMLIFLKDDRGKKGVTKVHVEAIEA